MKNSVLPSLYVATLLLVVYATATPVDFTLVKPPVPATAIVKRHNLMCQTPNKHLFFGPSADYFFCITPNDQAGAWHSVSGEPMWSGGLYQLKQTIIEIGFLDGSNSTHNIDSTVAYVHHRNLTDDYLTLFRVHDGTVLLHQQIANSSNSATYNIRTWKDSTYLYTNQLFVYVKFNLFPGSWSHYRVHHVTVNPNMISGSTIDYWAKNTPTSTNFHVMKDDVLFIDQDKDVVAIRRTDGVQRWVHNEVSSASPALIQEQFLVETAETTMLFRSSQTVFTLKLSDGSLRWNVSKAQLRFYRGGLSWSTSSAPTNPFTNDDFLMGSTVGTDEIFRMARATGIVYKYTPVCNTFSQLRITANQALYQCYTPKVNFTAYDMATGAVSWSSMAPYAGSYRQIAFYSSSLLWRDTTTAYHEISLTDGSWIWTGNYTLGVPSSLSHYQCITSYCLFVHSSTSVEVFNRQTGALVWNKDYVTNYVNITNTSRHRYQFTIMSVIHDSEKQYGWLLQIYYQHKIQDLFGSVWVATSTVLTQYNYHHHNWAGTVTPRLVASRTNLTNSYVVSTAIAKTFLLIVHNSLTYFTISRIDADTGAETWLQNFDHYFMDPCSFTVNYHTRDTNLLPKVTVMMVETKYAVIVIDAADGVLMQHLNYTWFGNRCDTQDCDKEYWTRQEFAAMRTSIISSRYWIQSYPSYALYAPYNATLVVFQNGFLVYNLNEDKVVRNVTFALDLASDVTYSSDPITDYKGSIVTSGVTGQGWQTHFFMLKHWIWEGSLLWNISYPTGLGSFGSWPTTGWVEIHNVTDVIVLDNFVIGKDYLSGVQRYNITTVTHLKRAAGTNFFYYPTITLKSSSSQYQEVLRLHFHTGLVDFHVASKLNANVYGSASAPNFWDPTYEPYSIPSLRKTAQNTLTVFTTIGVMVTYDILSGLPFWGAGFADRVMDAKYVNQSWVIVHGSGQVEVILSQSFPPVKSIVGRFSPFTGGNVYVTPSPDPKLLFVDGDDLTAYDLHSGVFAWNFTLRVYLQFQWVSNKAPVFAKGVAFFLVNEIIGTTDWRVVGVEWATGKLIGVFDPWTFRRTCGEHVNAIQVMGLGSVGENVYFSSGSHCIFKINVTSLDFTYGNFVIGSSTEKVTATSQYASIVDETNRNVSVFTVSPGTGVQALKRQWAYDFVSVGMIPLVGFAAEDVFVILYNQTVTWHMLTPGNDGTLMSNVVEGAAWNHSIFLVQSTTTSYRLYEVAVGSGAVGQFEVTAVSPSSTIYHPILYIEKHDVLIVREGSTWIGAVQGRSSLLWSKNFTTDTRYATCYNNYVKLGGSSSQTTWSEYPETLILMTCSSHLVLIDVLTGTESGAMLDGSGITYGYTEGVLYGMRTSGYPVHSSYILVNESKQVNNKFALQDVSTSITGAQAAKASQATDLTNEALGERAGATPQGQDENKLTNFDPKNLTGLSLVLIVVAAVIFLIIGVVIGKSGKGKETTAGAGEPHSEKQPPTHVHSGEEHPEAPAEHHEIHHSDAAHHKQVQTASGEMVYMPSEGNFELDPNSGYYWSPERNLYWDAESQLFCDPDVGNFVSLPTDGPQDLIFNHDTGYFWSESKGVYYDVESGMYCNPENGTWTHGVEEQV